MAQFSKDKKTTQNVPVQPKPPARIITPPPQPSVPVQPKPQQPSTPIQPSAPVQKPEQPKQ